MLASTFNQEQENVLKGFIAPTDDQWCSFLQARSNLEEINFWQPSGKRVFRALEPGDPFFFKLKKPHDAIAGFGIFLRAQVLPDWLAWECFGEANGAPTLQSLRDRIQRHRQKNRIAVEDPPTIGCIILSSPVFFKRANWIRQPADWKPNVVAGATYDLNIGEGRRVLLECQQRAASLIAATAVQESLAAFGAGRIVRPRLGQGSFKLAVADAYDEACAVTREHSRPALEAAHIRPYSLEQRHEINNGLLLRSDVHGLFDRGYVTIDTDNRFVVSHRLKDDFQNGKSYYPLHGRKIYLPRRIDDRPDPSMLKWHREQRFLG